jgi:hypothetical protein
MKGRVRVEVRYHVVLVVGLSFRRGFWLPEASPLQHPLIPRGDTWTILLHGSLCLLRYLSEWSYLWGTSSHVHADTQSQVASFSVKTKKVRKDGS